MYDWSKMLSKWLIAFKTIALFLKAVVFCFFLLWQFYYIFRHVCIRMYMFILYSILVICEFTFISFYMFIFYIFFKFSIKYINIFSSIFCNVRPCPVLGLPLYLSFITSPRFSSKTLSQLSSSTFPASLWLPPSSAQTCTLINKCVTTGLPARTRGQRYKVERERESCDWNTDRVACC